MNLKWAIYLAPVFKLLSVRVILWYAHGTVTRNLRIAHRLVGKVVTSSTDGFRIASRKRVVIGQGVDTIQFSYRHPSASTSQIITVGRISERKQIHRVIQLMEYIWSNEGMKQIDLVVVGAPITRSDESYFEHLKYLKSVATYPANIHFVGKKSPREISELYQRAFVHLNMSKTGSMDKTVLESLASGCPVVTTNEAFRELLKGLPFAYLSDEKESSIARAIIHHYKHRAECNGLSLRELVVGRHDIATYPKRILNEFESMR